jgi:hypothetical protein
MKRFKPKAGASPDARTSLFRPWARIHRCVSRVPIESFALCGLLPSGRNDAAFPFPSDVLPNYRAAIHGWIARWTVASRRQVCILRFGPEAARPV